MPSRCVPVALCWGLEERVKNASLKRSTAKAIEAAVNEGHREMGAKAAALCTRLADLRRQERLLQREKQKVEAQLNALMEEAGDVELETPAGTLRRLFNEGGQPEFILKV